MAPAEGQQRLWFIRPFAGDWAVTAFAVVWFLGVLLPLVGVIAFSVVRANAAGVSLSLTLDAYREIFTTGRWEVTARTVRIAATVTANRPLAL